MAALQARGAFKLQSVKQISANAAVATVVVGPVTLGSIWVNNVADAPVVAWPRSTRGFPIAVIEDDKLRCEIEDAIIAVVSAWRTA